ncbi:hypothetical protein LSG25_16905 [Paralcaligenes sp. KSB-10]|uniref:hypothetical protein n=1 Tax=Paralcaligenes sp. KSB-10 TaxID=2901142 RepID=UPI001E59F7A6|nr:hypothetical protein [Paralcaligenes sp. KSB-10]UHL63700.1 hypothetical protein LSG25_16905 [Paralcaligenes sp. KSB-10]
MNEATQPVAPSLGGIQLHCDAPHELDTLQESFLRYLKALDLDRYVQVGREAGERGRYLRFRLDESYARDWTPDFDTTQLCRKLGLDTQGKPDDLEREILLAMLAGPIAFPFPSYEELVSGVRIRANIVEGGRKTVLAFDTEHAERPKECWEYSEQRGFTLRPGQSLIASLEKTTQPGSSGKLYSFSCYRATEYVMLLGIARELANCNPPLMSRLQEQWGIRAIMSGEFHDIFLHEYGSLSDPLPFKYYVPGDRLWFRNPDEHSSNVEGYEGSWVFYLGDGLFTNFWKPGQHYTLTSKCVELFHWRNGVYRGQDGKLQIDEDVVDERVRQSLRDPAEVAAILEKMMRLREPAGVYVDGGCVDATREYVRCVCPGTNAMVFPGNAPPPPD